MQSRLHRGLRHSLSARLLRGFVGVLLTLFGSVASALDPGRTMSGYHTQVFFPRGAAVTQVTQVSQTDDGYLWVGTTSGLFRFDGVTFELMSSLGGHSIQHLPISTILAEPGGGLLVGYGGGAGSGRYISGVYTPLSAADGWKSLNSAAVDAEGVTWAVADHKLLRVANLIKQTVAADWGLEDVDVHEVVVDSVGTVWISLASGSDVMYLPRGEHRFRAVGQHFGARLLAASPDGIVYVSGPQGISAIVTHDGLPERIARISSQSAGRILADRDGGLLVSTPGGVAHVIGARKTAEEGGTLDLAADVLKLNFRSPDASAIVWCMTEDRDGNVWLGTNMGLERIRDTRLTPVALPQAGYTFSVVAGADGAVWASSYSAGLLKIENHSKVTVERGVGPRISAIYRDKGGSIWAGSPAGVWRSNGRGRFEALDIPSQFLQPWVASIAMDSSGSLWLMAADLVRGTPGRADWRKVTSNDGFSEGQSPWTMFSDTVGHIWMATGSKLMRVDDGKPRLLEAISSRLKVGAIQSFAEHNGHLWIGGIEGVALVRGDRVVDLRTRSGPPFSQVLSILETSNGELWVRGADDAWRVPAEELRDALSSGRNEVDVEHFDALDGLSSLTVRPRAELAEATDGLVWLSTVQGLSWFDPLRPHRPTPTPPAHIKLITVDAKVAASTTSIDIPPLSRHIEISYTAIELGYPERLQFRYKLDGFDREWLPAGTRRVAYYNELPPGDYQFRFASTDRDGRWHDEAASVLSLHVAPAWFQTLWFKVAVALAVILVATILYRLRMHQVGRRLHAQLKQQMAERDRILVTRQAERERIARELHDTLIQSTQGLIYLFQGLAERISPDERTRAQLENALIRANEVAAEGRDRIEDLRETVKVGTDLPRALAALGNDILAGREIGFRTIVTGVPREIGPAVIDALSWIGREALVNASRHAHATSVEVEIVHEDDSLVVSIHDNGVGIADEMLILNAPGHWGIQGMRERAKSIDATIDFVRRSPSGTQVRVTTPGTMAYGEMKGRFRWRSFERRSRHR